VRSPAYLFQLHCLKIKADHTQAIDAHMQQGPGNFLLANRLAKILVILDSDCTEQGNDGESTIAGNGRTLQDGLDFVRL
jgi:hypothetical protein